MGATDYLGMIGGIAGPIGIAGSALSGALGGALAGRSRRYMQTGTLQDVMKEIYSSPLDAGVRDQLAQSAFLGHSLALDSNSYRGIAIGINPANGGKPWRPEPTVDELLESDALDEWDRAWEAATGELPPFSRLVPARRDAY